MSDTTNQTKLGVDVIGSAVIALVIVVAVLAIAAIVTAQCCIS
jgi:hypothetical protein